MREEIWLNKTAEEIFRIFKDEPYAVFFDSALQDARLGRYSVILFEPFLVFSSKGNRTEIVRDKRQLQKDCDPLSDLKALLKKYAVESGPGALPCENGCAAGFISYDFGSVLEKLPDTAVEEIDVPHMLFGFYDTAIVVDHEKNQTYICAASGLSSREEQNNMEQRKITHIRETIFSAVKTRAAEPAGDGQPNRDIQKLQFSHKHSANAFTSDFSREDYCRMVEKAREHIRNGDIFQVNLSQRIRTTLPGDAYDVYRRLRSESPAPFACYLNFGTLRVMSSSPERFFRLEDGWIETRPIKGTRPRGRTEAEDIANREELLASEKDHAELAMIVDLERNDLGRISRIGSVKVTEFVELETYANVFHLVATVCGELSEGMDVTDCIRATFPGGSITGAPKIRAMEIIDELEPVKRNIYTGAIGYIGFDGTCDFNIAIRTIVAEGDQAFYQVGGGIVWDSVPEEEYKETLHKGSAILQVLKDDSMSEEADNDWKNSIADTDFGFLYGFSLFETFLVQQDGSVRLLDEHASRIFRSAEALGFTLPFDKTAWKTAVREYIASRVLRGKILRVTISFGNGGDTPPSLHFSVRDYIDPRQRADGYKICVSRTIRNETSPLTGHKTGNYAENFLALRDAAAKGYDDVLFLNSKKQVAETAKCNIFFTKGNTVYTPHLACGILPGIIREFVVVRAKALGFTVVEGDLSLEYLGAADAVFVTNSVMGIMPVTIIKDELTGIIWFASKEQGRITGLLQKEYNQV